MQTAALVSADLVDLVARAEFQEIKERVMFDVSDSLEGAASCNLLADFIE